MDEVDDRVEIDSTPFRSDNRQGSTFAGYLTSLDKAIVRNRVKDLLEGPSAKSETIDPLYEPAELGIID